MPGLFVTGTDTGAGKTIVSAALLAAITGSGERAHAHKPVLTGLEETAGTWPADHELLGALAHMLPEEVAPLRFRAAVAPHLAARLEQRTLGAEQILANARAALAHADRSGAVLVVEGVGGILCPLAENLAVVDLALELGLPTVVAARPGLGTINHTLLTLEAARWRGLGVRAVVLTPWPQVPAAMEISNRDTIAQRGQVEVVTLAHVDRPASRSLARAGADLPWGRWLEPGEWRHPAAVPGRATTQPLAVRAAELASAAARMPSVTAASSSSPIT